MTTAYRPDIDGLRAIAVLGVVLFHVDGAFVPGGFVGVDVFFVISGYLITRVIADQVAAGRFSFAGFYDRRARRILPALFAVLLIFTPIFFFVLTPQDNQRFAGSLLATLAFIPNMFFWRATGNYFDADTGLNPLLHTWSLGIEEQYYFIMPILLILAVRIFRRHANAALIAAVLASFALSWLAAVWFPHHNFYLLPTRFWELGVGSVLAVSAFPGPSKAWAEGLAAGALAVLALVYGSYTEATPFPGPTAVAPCLAVAVLLHVHASRATRVGALLSSRPMVAIGLISYSLYLWHWPVFTLINAVHGPDWTWPLRLAAFAVIAVASGLSWRFVEQPFRQKAWASAPALRKVLVGSSAAGVLALAGGAAVALEGFHDWFSPAFARVTDAAVLIDPRQRECLDIADLDRSCRFGDPDQQEPSFLVWGDSHAGAFLPAFDDAGRRAQRAGVLMARSAVAPILGVDFRVVDLEQSSPASAYSEEVVAYLDAHPAITTVFLVARWPIYGYGTRVAPEPGGEIRLVDTFEPGLDPSNPAVMQRGLERIVDRLSDMGRDVVIVTGAPEFGWDVPSASYRRLRFGAALPPAPTAASVALRNRPLMAAVDAIGARPRVSVIDVTPAICNPVCRTMIGGDTIYADDDHLSATGSRALVAPLLAPALAPRGDQSTSSR